MRRAEPIGRCLRRPLLMVFLALFSLVVRAGAGPSQAERAIFMSPHLADMHAPATLHYAYVLHEGSAPPVRDSADLSVKGDGKAGFRVSARFLSGERQLQLPTIDAAKANPVVLYFLEYDVRRMHAELGGSTNYFRRHIRMALADAAKVEPVRFSFGGVAHDGTRVRIEPFRDLPEAGRMKDQAHKFYEFILSPAVPGGVFDLRSTVPAADGTVLEETSLTLDVGGS
ncbi:hypothetical protein G3580_02765 [Nitrogeniibacter mangrovi]|uniref:Uncharacterized protein n=1 Tax=Nitrogeniibacter mangrovi TaxID=2016596 RepID=A0A6C1B162_9RHOO|nr:hypothetical protein [Nitrogeniibacter mangrovi]QID16645.1 hypothetical protein G3580_02765 [Nitrogeniibacter mangrovi]